MLTESAQSASCSQPTADVLAETARCSQQDRPNREQEILVRPLVARREGNKQEEIGHAHFEDEKRHTASGFLRTIFFEKGSYFEWRRTSGHFSLVARTGLRT
jgi:hypothetical protein